MFAIFRPPKPRSFPFSARSSFPGNEKIVFITITITCVVFYFNNMLNFLRYRQICLCIMYIYIMLCSPVILSFIPAKLCSPEFVIYFFFLIPVLLTLLQSPSEPDTMPYNCYLPSPELYPSHLRSVSLALYRYLFLHLLLYSGL